MPTLRSSAGGACRPRDPRSSLALALLVLTGAALWAPRIEGGAWTQPRGGYYGRLAFAGIDTGTRFDGLGDRIAYQTSGTIARDAEYRSRELRGYGEYGATERLTMYGSLTHKRLAVEERTAVRETDGLGDLYLGGRFRVTRSGFPLSVAGEVKFPTGYATGDNPALGAGQIDGVVKALAGFSRTWWYATGDLGWMVRDEGYRDQVTGSLEAGGQVKRCSGRALVRWAQSVGEVDATTGSLGFDPARASPRMVLLDGAFGVELLSGLILEVALSHALVGRDALAGNTLELALVRSGRIGGSR